MKHLETRSIKHQTALNASKKPPCNNVTKNVILILTSSLENEKNSEKGMCQKQLKTQYKQL